ncbi:MAG TPA: hypothetical protein V6C69_10535 [Trichormus sp.]|jgi:hypothetical protein
MASNNFENGAENSSRRESSEGGSPFRHDVSFSSQDFWAAHNAHHGSGSNENLPNISISDNQNGGTSDSNQASSQNGLSQQMNSFLQEFEQFFQQFQQGGTGDSSATNNSPSSGDSSTSSNGDTSSNGGQSDNSQAQRHQPTDSTQPSQGGGGGGDCTKSGNNGGTGDTTTQNNGGSDGGTSGTVQGNSGSDTTQSGGDSTQSGSGGQTGTDTTPTQPATPTIADQAASVVSQVDNSAQSGDFLGALTTLNNSEQAFKSSDPTDSGQFSQDLLTGIEHTNTSDGKTGADVMNALSEADIAYNWSSLSKPDGDKAYMDPQDLLNDVAASSDPVSKALLANGAANFGSFYGLGTVQNDDVANDMQLNEAEFAQVWTKSF